MKAASVTILWEDDEGCLCETDFTIGDVQVFEEGSLPWKRTLKEIVIKDDCLLDHDGTCEECAWNEVGK